MDETSKKMDKLFDNIVWLRLREYAKKAISVEDYSFLDGFQITDAQKAALICLLRYSSDQDSFPRIPNMFALLNREKISPSHGLRLRDSGMLLQIEKGVWYVSPLVFKNAAKQLGLTLPDVPNLSKVIIKRDRKKKKEKPLPKTEISFGMIKSIYDVLQSRKRDSKLLLTPEDVKDLACQIGCTERYIYRVLSKLEGYGLIKRRRKGHKQGFIIRINDAQETAKPAKKAKKSVRPVSAVELMKKNSEGRISDIQKKLDAVEKMRARLSEELEAEKSFLAEFKKRAETI